MTRTAFVFLAALLPNGCSSSKPELTAPPGPVASNSTFSTKYSAAVIANGNAERLVQATFLDGASPFPCTSETVAGCLLGTCPRSAAPTSTGTVVDPGKLTASSASLGMGTLTMTGGHGLLDQPGDFADGESVHVIGAGSAAVKAFDLQIVVPSHLYVKRLDACEVPNADCLVQSPNPNVEWSGGDGGQVTVTLQDTLDEDGKQILACKFDAAPGFGAIPAAALAKLRHDRHYHVSFSSIGPAVSDAAADVSLWSMRTVTDSLTVQLAQ